MAGAGSGRQNLAGALHRYVAPAMPYRIGERRADPARFLNAPPRHPFAYFPFSAGPRQCIGKGLVAIEAPLVLATIQYRGDIAKLAARYGPQPRSLTAALSALVGVLGIVGLAFVYFRL